MPRPLTPEPDRSAAADAPPDRVAAALALVDEALAVGLADPARSADMALQAAHVAQADGAAPVQALALLVATALRLRDSPAIAVQAALDEAQSLAAGSPGGRADWWMQYLRARIRLRDGQVEDGIALLQGLWSRRERTPQLDAYYAAMALGTALSLRERADESLATQYEGLGLARATQSLSLECNALNNIGATQLDLHNLDDALPLLQRALECALALGSRRQRIFAAGNLVQCLCAMGRAAEALPLAREHLIGLIHADDPPSLQRDEEIAHVLLDCGLHAQAAERLAREHIPDPLTNPMSATRAWLEARLQLAVGRSDAALALCLAKADLLDDKAVMPLDRVRLAEITALAAAEAQDFRVAYRFQHRAGALKDLLLGRAARARFVSLQIQHDLAHVRGERDAARQAAHGLQEANSTLRAQLEADERLRQRLLAQALEDPLTGLGNRRHLMSAGPQALARAVRHGQPMAVALMDLDHFKSVNDRHGHDCGDRVLQAFARTLRAGVRGDDLCGRYGGEEFVAVFVGLDATAAAERIRALQAAFAREVHQAPGGASFTCGFSAGVSECVGADDRLDDLLAAADRALYDAKAAGRGCVRVAPPHAPA